MNNFDYEKLHAGIVKYAMEDASYADEASLASFYENEVKFGAAQVRAIEEDDVNLISTLPYHGDQIFVTVTDGDVSEIQNVMTHIESMILKGHQVQKFDVVRFDSDYLQSKKVVGCIILPIRVSPALNHIPEQIDFGGMMFKFYLVTFLSADEYKLWKESGSNELMNTFDMNDKDLISVEQN